MLNTGKDGKPFGAMDVRRALRGRLAGYKIPVEVRVLSGIPRNAMGKGEFYLFSLWVMVVGLCLVSGVLTCVVNKKSLVKEVFG